MSPMSTLADKYEAFFFDCDGTLYHAGHAIPGAPEMVKKLISMGKKVFFVTNTSSRDRGQLKAKLEKLGFGGLEESSMYPSCVYAAEYVRKHHPSAKKVYVTGGEGLVNEFKRVGFEVVGGPGEQQTAGISENDIAPTLERLGIDNPDTKFDGVICGWDLEFTFQRLAIVSAVLNGGKVGAHAGEGKKDVPFFYATNDDLYDTVGGFAIPGTGACLPAIEALAKVSRPEPTSSSDPFGNKAISLGKPNPNYIKQIAEWENLDLKKAVFIGDRLDTDILMGHRAEMATIFVQTGVHREEHIQHHEATPTHILSHSAEITEGQVGTAINSTSINSGVGVQTEVSQQKEPTKSIVPAEHNKSSPQGN